MWSPVKSFRKASIAELRCFIWCYPEQAFEQTVELPVAWGAMKLIQHHRNAAYPASENLPASPCTHCRSFKKSQVLRLNHINVICQEYLAVADPWVFYLFVAKIHTNADESQFCAVQAQRHLLYIQYQLHNHVDIWALRYLRSIATQVVIQKLVQVNNKSVAALHHGSFVIGIHHWPISLTKGQQCIKHLLSCYHG